MNIVMTLSSLASHIPDGRGARNVFQVDDLDIGKLLYVVIGHDNTGAGASWHLDHMVVTNMTTGVSFLVPGRCWFAVGHGDGAVERSLEVAPALEAPVEYLVNCVTSDMRGAGTDADVFVVLHGHSGVSPRIMLPSAPEDFERGTKSAFAITTPDVGDLQRLTISHNNKVGALGCGGKGRGLPLSSRHRYLQMCAYHMLM